MTGSALPANNLRQSPNQFGTETGTVQDEIGSFPPDLSTVVSAWPALSEGDRKAMLAIIREAAARVDTLGSGGECR